MTDKTETKRPRHALDRRAFLKSGVSAAAPATAHARMSKQ